MKKALLLLTALFFISLSSFAQNAIELQIHHQLGEAPFELNVAAENNLGHQFFVSRVQYYISEISIVHDGGQETAIEDVWLLIDASKPVIAELGNYNISEVEAVRFHVGVDPDHNHLDPASWPPLHPLAPQFPSMHWGWVAGYRFAALEGKAGAGLNQTFELHPLGDDHYFQTEVALTASAIDGKIAINLDADISRSLENIPVKDGVIVHGDYGMAITCLENFRDYVFSASALTSSTQEQVSANTFEIYPNPSFDGNATIVLATPADQTCEVIVSDLLGRTIRHYHALNGQAAFDLHLEQPGLYFISVMQDGKAAGSKKWIVK